MICSKTNPLALHCHCVGNPLSPNAMAAVQYPTLPIMDCGGLWGSGKQWWQWNTTDGACCCSYPHPQAPALCTSACCWLLLSSLLRLTQRGSRESQKGGRASVHLQCALDAHLNTGGWSMAVPKAHRAWQWPLSFCVQVLSVGVQGRWGGLGNTPGEDCLGWTSWLFIH